jgi:hypothetical protein
MKKPGFCILALVLACSAARTGAAPHNGAVRHLSQAGAAAPESAQVRQSGASVQVQGTPGEESRAHGRKAAPSGPGLQFHRYPPG